MNTPICHKLRELEEKHRIPFHMPGHKRKNKKEFEDILKKDITEITDYDNLHHPTGMIRESMNLMKKIYGTKKSWYLVNGSTVGILASISALCQQGDKILIGRNCHKAVYNSIKLLRLIPVYYYPEYQNKYDILEDISRIEDSRLIGDQKQIEDCELLEDQKLIKDCELLEDQRPIEDSELLEHIRKMEDCRTSKENEEDSIEMILKKNTGIKAAIITSPTYEGVVTDVARLKKTLNKYDIPLIVDEAHGAHFKFHNYFPKSAVETGGDLVIQSTHKTLPSMTQTALLHLCSDKISSNKVQEMLSIYETSSPSYILMASAEYGVMYMNENGDEIKTYVDNLEKFRMKCAKLKVLHLVKKEDILCFDYDRGKLVFSIKNSDIDGKELFDIMLEKYRIEFEMASMSYCIAMTSVCDEEMDFTYLWDCISEVDWWLYEKQKKRREEGTRERQTRDKENGGKLNYNFRGRQTTTIRPEKILESWQCSERKKESVSLEKAQGRIAGEFVMLYPPGIPLLVPGEKIPKEIVENISYYLYNGYNLLGLKNDDMVVLI